MDNSNSPHLHITYSPHLSLRFQFLSAERVASVGSVSWQFALHCTIRHSKGQFTYDASDLYIDIDAFERFHDELASIAAGKRRDAELRDAGRMVCFALHLDGRRLKSTVRIRESQADDDMSYLTGGFTVDYDLFINKLRGRRAGVRPGSPAGGSAGCLSRIHRTC